MDEDNKLKWILAAFIVIVVGISLVIAIDESLSPITRTSTNNNESVSLVSVIVTDAGNQTINQSIGINLSNNDIISVSAIYNSSNATGTVLTLNTDYWVNNTNYNVFFINSTRMILQLNKWNTSYVTYSYYPSTYVKDRASRVLINFVLLFFIIAIIGYVIYYCVEKTGLYKFNF